MSKLQFHLCAANHRTNDACMHYHSYVFIFEQTGYPRKSRCNFKFTKINIRISRVRNFTPSLLRAANFDNLILKTLKQGNAFDLSLGNIRSSSFILKFVFRDLTYSVFSHFNHCFIKLYSANWVWYKQVNKVNFYLRQSSLKLNLLRHCCYFESLYTQPNEQLLKFDRLYENFTIITSNFTDTTRE